MFTGEYLTGFSDLLVFLTGAVALAWWAASALRR